MNSKSNQKKPLCKFMNKCNQFKSTKTCKFAHDLCRFGQKCKDSSNCKFYHPQLKQTHQSNSLQRAPISQISYSTTCKYGKDCRNKESCKFIHDTSDCSNPRPPNTNKETTHNKSMANNVQCKYGAMCMKYPQGKCQYKHPDQQQQIVKPFVDSSMFPNTIDSQIIHPDQESQHPTPILAFSAEFLQFQSRKQCKDFALGRCLRDDCGMTHQLTLDSSIKRTYYKQIVSESHCLCCWVTMFRVNGNLIYPVAFERSLALYELDEGFETLKSVCSNEVETEAKVTYLSILSCSSPGSSTQQSPQLVYATQNNKISILDPLLGTIQSITLEGSQVSGAVYLGDQNYLAVASPRGLTVIKNQQIRQDILSRICIIGPEKFRNITTFKNWKVLGDRFTTLGTETGNIILINQNLSSKLIQIPNSSIHDICVVSYNGKPFALTSATQSSKTSSVFCINLLDLSWTPVLTSQTLKLSKLCSISDTVCVGVDGVGVLVYSLPDFRKIRGRIPFGGNIWQLEADKEGNLLIVQKEPSIWRTSISMYKVRR